MNVCLKKAPSYVWPHIAYIDQLNLLRGWCVRLCVTYVVVVICVGVQGGESSVSTFSIVTHWSWPLMTVWPALTRTVCFNSGKQRHCIIEKKTQHHNILIGSRAQICAVRWSYKWWMLREGDDKGMRVYECLTAHVKYGFLFTKVYMWKVTVDLHQICQNTC